MQLKLCDQQLILNLHVRAMAITFDFGKHNDIYFGNLEGHRSLNPLKKKLYISGFEKNDVQAVPRKFPIMKCVVF